jgi:triacylglycerol lipase
MFSVCGVGCIARRPNDAKIKQDADDPKLDHPCSIADKNTSGFDGNLSAPAAGGGANLSKRDWSMVRSAAMLSKLAYKDDATIVKTTAKSVWGYTKTDIIIGEPMRAFVASNDKCVVVVFRGTDFFSGKDWFADLTLGVKAFGTGSIHNGFLDAFDLLAKDLKTALDAHGADTKTVWVTGHSLGGALAGVSAFSNELRRLLPPYTSDVVSASHPFKIEHVITFGQPIFMNAVLADQMREVFEGRYLRIVNDSDLVTRMAFWFSPFGDYVWMRPAASELFIDKKMSRSVQGTGNGATLTESERSRDPAENSNADSPKTDDETPQLPQEMEATQATFNEYQALRAAPSLVRARSFPQGRNRNTPLSFQPKSITDHGVDLYLGRVTGKWRDAK